MSSLKTKDIRRVRGETIKLRFTVRDADGALVNLTGYTVYFRVRPDPKAAPTISLASTDFGNPIVIQAQSGLTLGVYDVTVSHALSAALAVGDHVFDSWIVSPAGEYFAVVAPSRLSILQEVTTLP